VSDISDLWSIEKAGFYKGKYHVLGGRLSAIGGITPDDLNIHSLLERIGKDGTIREAIVAMSADLDGHATVHFIRDKLKETKISKVTTLSHGVPMGGELEYLDSGTIIAAFNNRREVI
jgi:recombination protein RecR